MLGAQAVILGIVQQPSQMSVPMRDGVERKENSRKHYKLDLSLKVHISHTNNLLHNRHQPSVTVAFWVKLREKQLANSFWQS